MAKHPTKRAACEVAVASPVEPSDSRVDLLGFLMDARRGLLALAVNAGLKVLGAMLEEDRGRLCGPKGRPDPDREATRYRYDDGSVVLGGRRVGVRKPRMRTGPGANRTEILAPGPSWTVPSGSTRLGTLPDRWTTPTERGPPVLGRRHARAAHRPHRPDNDHAPPNQNRL